MIMVMMTIEGMKVVIKLNITTSLEEITIYRKKMKCILLSSPPRLLCGSCIVCHIFLSVDLNI